MVNGLTDRAHAMEHTLWSILLILRVRALNFHGRNTFRQSGQITRALASRRYTASIGHPTSIHPEMHFDCPDPIAAGRPSLSRVWSRRQFGSSGMHGHWCIYWPRARLVRNQVPGIHGGWCCKALVGFLLAASLGKRLFVFMASKDRCYRFDRMGDRVQCPCFCHLVCCPCCIGC